MTTTPNLASPSSCAPSATASTPQGKRHCNICGRPSTFINDNRPVPDTGMQERRTKPYYEDDHVTLYPDTTVREDDSRVRELQDRLDAVVALARKWATQPTDWDEDTEQQIEDETELLTLLGLALEEQP